MLNQINLPNKLTLFRIFIVPLLIVFLISPSTVYSLIAAFIFLVASLTDWLDGHLARSTNQITTLGKILDPVADKLLICSTLIPLVALGRVPSWMAVILIGREIAVTGLRSIATVQGVVVPAGTLGKYKMVFEIVGVFFLILNFDLWLVHLHFLGMVGLWIALIFGVISGVDYCVKIFQGVDFLEQEVHPPSFRPSPSRPDY
jgi:CDP-diacylglycerol--glycerol-3-phosphate 3-phosphatidyltransferase